MTKLEKEFNLDYKGHKTLPDEDWYEAEFDAGNLGWQEGLIVGYVEPLKITDHTFDKGRYLFWRYEDGAILDVHENRLKKTKGSG